MSSKKSLVTTTYLFFKEGIMEMGTKPNVVKEAINPPIEKINIDTFNKTDKPQVYKKG